MASKQSRAARHLVRLGAPAKTVAVLGVVAALGLAFVQSGCETTPVRALRGARHYAAGNEALERNDGARAVAELERAADLVPHASEIQNHLGLAYWSEGELDEARLSFERALELDCENQAAAANLEELRTSNGFTFDTRYTSDGESAHSDGVGGNTDGG